MNLIEYLKLCETYQHEYFHTDIYPPYNGNIFGIHNTRPIISIDDKVKITNELNDLLRKHLHESNEVDVMTNRLTPIKHE